MLVIGSSLDRRFTDELVGRVFGGIEAARQYIGQRS
jgi:hypothetical protein